MKINSVLCTLMVAGALFAANDCFASNTGASWAAVVAEEQNAAELYRAAWERHAELMSAFNEELQRTDLSKVDAAWVPEKETLAVLRACRPLVEDLIRASQAGEADWVVDGDDLFAPLTHHGRLRSSVRLLAADARVRMGTGDHAGAAERIAAMLRMSGQLRGDELISALLAMGVFDVGSQMAEQFINESSPDPEHMRPIREAVDAIPDEDPFAMLDAIKGERRRSTARIRNWAEAGAPPEKAPPVLDGPLRFAEAVVVMAWLERLDAYYEELIEAWRSDDPPARIAALEQAADAGEYGMLTKIMAPAMGVAYQADQRTRARIAEVRAMLGEHGAGGR